MTQKQENSTASSFFNGAAKGAGIACLAAAALPLIPVVAPVAILGAVVGGVAKVGMDNR